jgi:hypothetical protein
MNVVIQKLNACGTSCRIVSDPNFVPRDSDGGGSLRTPGESTPVPRSSKVADFSSCASQVRFAPNFGCPDISVISTLWANCGHPLNRIRYAWSRPPSTAVEADLSQFSCFEQPHFAVVGQDLSTSRLGRFHCGILAA